MSTTKNKEPDYQEYMRSSPPTRDKKTGHQVREQRRAEKAKTLISIRLDADLLEAFKQLSPKGRGYQSLINQALREWLAAQGVKELIREQISDLVGIAVESIKEAAQTSRG